MGCFFAGWVNRSQQDVIEYLHEENSVLREPLARKRLLFTRAFGELFGRS